MQHRLQSETASRLEEKRRIEISMGCGNMSLFSFRASGGSVVIVFIVVGVVTDTLERIDAFDTELGAVWARLCLSPP